MTTNYFRPSGKQKQLEISAPESASIEKKRTWWYTEDAIILMTLLVLSFIFHWPLLLQFCIVCLIADGVKIILMYVISHIRGAKKRKENTTQSTTYFTYYCGTTLSEGLGKCWMNCSHPP